MLFPCTCHTTKDSLDRGNKYQVSSIKYCGDITFFFLFISANVVSVHLMVHDQGFTGQVEYLIGNYFSN